jgi:hypothetical protein
MAFLKRPLRCTVQLFLNLGFPIPQGFLFLENFEYSAVELTPVSTAFDIRFSFPRVAFQAHCD